MRVGIVVSRSRGDVQPMLAVAVGLRAAGHDALVMSSADNAGWVRSLGCAFVPVGEPLRENASLGEWGFRPPLLLARRAVLSPARPARRLSPSCG